MTDLLKSNLLFQMPNIVSQRPLKQNAAHHLSPQTYVIPLSWTLWKHLIKYVPTSGPQDALMLNTWWNGEKNQELSQWPDSRGCSWWWKIKEGKVISQSLKGQSWNQLYFSYLYIEDLDNNILSRMGLFADDTILHKSMLIATNSVSTRGFINIQGMGKHLAYDNNNNNDNKSISRANIHHKWCSMCFTIYTLKMNGQRILK